MKISFLNSPKIYPEYNNTLPVAQAVHHNNSHQIHAEDVRPLHQPITTQYSNNKLSLKERYIIKIFSEIYVDIVKSNRNNQQK